MTEFFLADATRIAKCGNAEAVPLLEGKDSCFFIGGASSRGSSLEAVSGWSPTLVGDQFQDKGVVWAVPTFRVSVERRLMRRISHPFFRIKPKDYIKSCHVCGHFHLAHTTCGHCYGKLKQETEQLRDIIAQRLKLEPVETEVVVAYQGEKKQGHCMVAEVDRPRPAWFTKNLTK